MVGEWEEKTVAELQATGALLVEDGNHGENRPLPDEFSTEGVQFIRAADMDGGRVLFESAQRINEVARKRVRKGIGAGGDILLSHKGTVGKVAYVPPDAPPFVCSPQTTFWRVMDAHQLERRYIYFFLLSQPFRDQLDSRKGETDMADYVSLTTQRTLKVTVPPISVQKAIAAVLGGLDDKIELNRRMNATLEAMARALFQSWFVDFDPVRAKLDGRQPPGLDEATAALFPATFQDSPLGPIPQGWTVDTIKTRASNIQYGFTQSATQEPIGPHFLRITDIRGGAINWACVPYCQATAEERVKYRVMDGDLFIARTGASTGDNIYVVEPPDAVFASYLIRVQFVSRGFGRLAGEFARTPDYANHIAGNIGGSAQPNASAQTLATVSMVFPTEDIADAFFRRVRPLDLRRAANDRESRTLATLRDTLLPKLLSGELSVRNLPVLSNAGRMDGVESVTGE